MTMPERIFVNGDAHVFLAPAGTPEPTDPGGPYDAALVEVGLFTDDSLRFATEAQFEPITAHQSDRPAAWLQTGESATLAVELQEWSAASFRSVYGGGTVSESPPNSGIWRFDPPAYGADEELLAVVRCVDGGRTYALVCPRVVVTEGVEQDLGKGGASVLPLSLEVLFSEGVECWYWLTNDVAAFGGGATSWLPPAIGGSGVVSAEAFGTAALSAPGTPQTIGSPAGVVSAQAFGAATVAAAAAVAFPDTVLFPDTDLYPNGA